MKRNKSILGRPLKAIKYTRKVLAVGVCVAFFIGCGDTHQTPVDPVAQTVGADKPQLEVIVYDISKSQDDFLYLQAQHLHKMAKGIAFGGGGTLCVLHIKSKSLEQDPQCVTINPIDVIAPVGTALMRERIDEHNAAQLEQLDHFVQRALAPVCHRILVDKEAQFSDVEGAISLVHGIFVTPNFSDYNKTLLVISDLDHQLKSRGHRHLTPSKIFDLPEETIVALVRPKEEYAREVFPDHTTSVFVTIDDAIDFVSPPQTMMQ